MKVVYWWKLSIDESYLLMKVVYWWKLSLADLSSSRLPVEGKSKGSLQQKKGSLSRQCPLEGIRNKTRNPHLWQLDGETGERDVTPDEEEDGISLECTTQEGRGRNVESVTEDENLRRQIPDIHTWAKPLRSDERFTIRGNPFIDGYEEIVVFAPPGIPLSQIKSALKPDFDWDHIRPTSYTQRKWVYYPWSTNTLQEISQLLQAGSIS